MKLSTFLGKAKQIIKNEDFWAKNSYHTDDSMAGAHCMLGALEAAGKKEEDWMNFERPTSLMTKAGKLLVEIIRGHEKWKDRLNGKRDIDAAIPSFNDHDDTKHKEVMKIFTEAQRRAKLEEAKK